MRPVDHPKVEQMKRPAIVVDGDGDSVYQISDLLKIRKSCMKAPKNFGNGEDAHRKLIWTNTKKSNIFVYNLISAKFGDEVVTFF